MPVDVPVEAARCPACGAAVSPALLACPSCHALRHAGELKELAARADAASSDDPAAALVAWRRALELVPASSAQARGIEARIAALVARVPEAVGAPAPVTARRGPFGLIAAGALAVWKLKWLIAFVATKGKIALFGLTKVTTLLSMLATVGVYWALFGWPLAVGFVVSLYLHEIGHVAALRRLGIKADAPMFIPGLGAFVRMRQRPASAREDAMVGLAGPIWGTLVALAFAALFFATDVGVLGAIARLGAWVNLFNLLPVGSLDGGRGFAALSRPMRAGIAALLIGLTLASGDGLVMLLAIAAVIRVLMRGAPAEGDRRTLATFAVLLLVLAALTHIEVPGAAELAEESTATP